MKFREAFYKLVPSWLSSGDGELVLYSLGLMKDAMAERFRLSYEADLPEYAPADALAYMGRDRRIRRGINEPAAAYAARLIRFLDDHLTQGNPFALMDQLFAYLQTSTVRLRTVDRRGNWFTRDADGTRSFVLDEGNWDWDGGVLTSWGRFWVIIDSSSGPWTTQWTHPGGSATDGTTTATADEIAGVMSIIREWKPAGTRCEWVVVSFDEAAFDPIGQLGWLELDGTNDYVDHGAPAALNFERTDSWTFAAWVRDDGGAAQQCLFSKRKTVAPFEGYSLVRRSDYAYDFVAKDDAALVHICRTSVIPVGGWTLVALRVSTVSAGATSLRINDVNVTVSSSTDLTGSMMTAASVSVGALGAGSIPWLGDLGPYGVWDRVLTDTECTAIYAAGRQNTGAAWQATAPLLFANPATDTYPTITDLGSGGNDGTMMTMDAYDMHTDQPEGGWGDWSEDGRPVRFRGARYWRGPR